MISRRILKNLAASTLVICTLGMNAQNTALAGNMKWHMGSAWTQEERNESLQLFADLIGTYSDGDISVKFSPSGLLGTHDELFHGVQEGSLEIAIVAPYTNFVPGGMLNWMPWTVSNYDEAAIAYKAPDGILYKVMDEAYREVGLKLLWSAPGGAFGLGNNVRPLKHPEDLKDLKLRVSSAVGFVSALQNMGTNTGMTLQTVPWADLYNALERHVVDGTWSLWSSLVEERHSEVLHYYTDLGFGWDSANVVMNRDLWDSLSEDQQTAIWKAAATAEQRDYEAHRRADKQFQVKLKESGMDIYMPTANERSQWRNKANMPAIWHDLADPWLEKHYPGQNMGQTIRDDLAKIRTMVSGE